MPTIILTVDSNTAGATAGLAQTVNALGTVEGAIARVTTAATSGDSAWARYADGVGRSTTLLDQFSTRASAAEKAMGRINAMLDAQNTLMDRANALAGTGASALDSWTAAQSRGTTGVDAMTAAILRQNAAMGDSLTLQRLAGSGAFGGSANTVAGRTAVASDLAAAESSRFGRAGAVLAGGAASDIGVLGRAGNALLGPEGLAVGALLYGGYKTVSAANQYNQSITDVVGSSSQNAALIPAFQQGILGLAGGQNRFTPQQLTTAAYPVASDPTFGNNADMFLAAMKVISAQAQPAGAAALPVLASADIGAAEAFRLTSAQGLSDVADIISKGANVGLAEPSDFAKGVGTFAPSAYAAGLTGTGGLSQAAGLFAQSSLLSPRFRFDAQGENALFQQVTGKQSTLAASVEKSLGISNLFGVNAIGNAGGLAPWLQDIQKATAGSHQQDFLQALFPRQNALQAIRGATGENFQSAQERIAQTGNFTGTVAAGAGIADQGPQAKWDQIGSKFNQDIITVGDTISQTLNPDLLKFSTALEGASGKLGDFLGAMGDGIDHWNAWLNQRATIVDLPNVPGSLGNAISAGFGGAKVPAGFSGAVLPPGTVADPTMNLPGTQAKLYLPTADGGVGLGNGVGESWSTRLNTVIAARALTGGGGPTYQQPLTGGGGPTYVPPIGTQLQQGYAALQLIGQQSAALAAIHGQTAATSAFTLNAPTRNIRSLLNLDESGGASNATLNADLAALHKALSGSAYTTAQRSGIYGQEAFKVGGIEKAPGDNDRISAAQSALDFAQAMHEPLSQQKAIFDEYIAAQRQLARDTESGSTLHKTLRGITQQATLYGYQNDSAGVSRQVQDYQNVIAMDQLSGNTSDLAKAQQNLLAYQQAHAGQLGFDKSDLALMAAQNAQSLLATNPITNTHPFFQKNAGLGTFEAGEGSTLVRSGGFADPTTTEIRTLQRELATANNTIISLLGQIAKQGAVKAQTASRPRSQSGAGGLYP